VKKLLHIKKKAVREGDRVLKRDDKEQGIQQKKYFKKQATCIFHI